MSITCQTCGYDSNPHDAEFCEACGAELKAVAANIAVPEPATVSTPEPTFEIPPGPGTPTIVSPQPTFDPPPGPGTPTIVSQEPTFDASSSPGMPSTSPCRCLVAKQQNAPQTEFPLSGVAIVGVFDPDSGPVDIDLESFLGGDTVSRQHGEIYPDTGGWMVKDLGSLNGIFIKPKGQTRFGARITTPTSLNPGDEIAFGKVQFIFKSP